MSLVKHDEGKEEHAPIHVSANKKHLCYFQFILMLSSHNIVIIIIIILFRYYNIKELHLLSQFVREG